MSIHKGEHGSCETVRIVAPVTDENPSGYILINTSDFDQKVHERYEEPKAEKKDDGKGGKAKKDEGKKEDTGKDDGKGGK